MIERVGRIERGRAFSQATYSGNELLALVGR